MADIMPAEKAIERAWSVRKAFFPDQIEFNLPDQTLPVSVTGQQCELKCAHCNGIYLEKMVDLDCAIEYGRSDIRSYLLSGGCSADGQVPLLRHIDQINLLGRKGLLNCHTGLVSEMDARAIASVAEVVSFDFVGDLETVREVYGLMFDVDHYLASYRSLIKYTRVVPHICIGLKGGKISGEYISLDRLRHEAVEAISFLVFRPTAGTSYACASPPPLEEVARFLSTARAMFPSTPLYLGCMRPGGRYRVALDLIALRCGINKIVRPTPAARQEAEHLGMHIDISRECCSL